MGKIKSALEIAMERTETVKGDREQIAQYEAKQKGKKLANEFLEDKVESLEDEIKRTPKDEQENLKQGIFDILISRISLPARKDDLKQLEKTGLGLMAVIGGKSFTEMAGQLVQVMSQYLDEAAQYGEAIKRQYAPKLQQKEEEIARRLGRQVKLDPFQDPEFVHFYNQHMNSLKANYQSVLDEVREEAVRLFKHGGNYGG